MDGSLGVTQPSSKSLIVLYMAQGGEITKMWMTPDKQVTSDELRSLTRVAPNALSSANMVQGVGADGSVGEAQLKSSDIFRKFSAIVHSFLNTNVAMHFSDYATIECIN